MDLAYRVLVLDYVFSVLYEKPACMQAYVHVNIRITVLHLDRSGIVFKCLCMGKLEWTIPSYVAIGCVYIDNQIILHYIVS